MARQVQEGVLVLVGFGDQEPSRAVQVVTAAEVGAACSEAGGRLPGGAGQDDGEHGAGAGLARPASDSDHLAEQARVQAEGLVTAQHRHPSVAGHVQFGVPARDGSGVHQRRHPAGQVGGVMPVPDRDAELGQVVAQRALFLAAAFPADVAAGHVRAVVAQQGSQGALPVAQDPGQVRGGERGGQR